MIEITQKVDIPDIVTTRNIRSVESVEFASEDGFAACFAAAALWLQKNKKVTLIGLDKYIDSDSEEEVLYLFYER